MPGATPKATRSASESYWMPKELVERVSRAMRPSSASQSCATRIITAASQYCLVAPPRAALQAVARPHPAHDAPGEGAGDLLEEVAAPAALEHERGALVVERGLVGEGGAELARRAAHLRDGRRDRAPIHVHVERRHEDADARRRCLEHALLALLDHGHHAPVGGRDDQPLVARR